MELKTVDVQNLAENTFNLIGKDWMLITAEKDGKANTMTASWGGLGVLWAHNVAYIFVRKSRFTKEFIDNSENFSLTFLDHEQYAKTLGYLGSTSGRTEDKIAKSGLTLAHHAGVPYFAEAKLVLLCKKLSCHLINPDGILDPSILPKWYSDSDFHCMYIGEITEALKK